MKKTITLCLFLITVTIKAQIFTEDFNAGIPATFTLTDADGSTSASTVITGTGSFSAVAIVNEDCAGSVSWFAPAGQADDWMVTPAINIPNTTNGVVLKFDGIAFEAAYSDGVEVYVSTTGTSPSDFTSPAIYNSTPTTPGPNPVGGELDVWTERIVSLNSFVGQTIYIAFRNNSNDMHVLGIDNIMVQEMQDDNAELTSINILPYYAAPANISVAGEIKNQGGNNITSMDITWTDGTSSYTDNITGINISPGSTYNFTHTNPLIVATPTITNLTVTIDLVNASIDPDTSNNTLSTTLTIVNALAVRQPLIETFTSSTCGPCAPANVTAEALFLLNPGKFTSIKYQADWPGSGDPYYTDEVGNRIAYYAINSVPRMEIDGGWDENGNNITQQVLDDHIDVISLVNLSATYSINIKTVDIDITIDPLENYLSTNLVVHAAIIEETTYNNFRTNGETQFEHVVKKMLPNDNGTSIPSLVGGTQSTLNQSYTFNGNYRLPTDASNPVNHAIEHSVEDFSNLMVAVWIQDVITKEVHQSTMATLSSIVSETFNCVNNSCTDPLDGSGTYNDINSCETACNITSVQENNTSEFNIYPNPIKDVLTIDGIYNSVNIYDVFGKLVLTSETQKIIDVSSLSNGVYFVNINTENTINVKKITVTK